MSPYTCFPPAASHHHAGAAAAAAAPPQPRQAEDEPPQEDEFFMNEEEEMEAQMVRQLASPSSSAHAQEQTLSGAPCLSNICVRGTLLEHI